MFIPHAKACPYCASRDFVVDALGSDARPHYAVRCCDCEATGPIARSYDAAVEKWNHRPKSDGDGQ